MMTSTVLSDLGTLLAPVEDLRPASREEHRDIGPVDLGDLWIDLGCGD